MLDANILMRAVLGRRVRELLETYEDAASFYSPDVCFADARHYLGNLLEKRGRDPANGLVALDQLSGTVQFESRRPRQHFERSARITEQFRRERAPSQRRALEAAEKLVGTVILSRRRRRISHWVENTQSEILRSAQDDSLEGFFRSLFSPACRPKGRRYVCKAI